MNTEWAKVFGTKPIIIYPNVDGPVYVGKMVDLFDLENAGRCSFLLVTITYTAAIIVH